MATTGSDEQNPLMLDQANPDIEEAKKVVEGAKEISKEAFEKGVRRLLRVTVKGYPKALRSTASRRNELLRKHGGDQAAAVEDVRAQAAAIVEETKTWVLGLVPYVGLPATVLYPTWRALRRVCLLAGVYGHDLDAEETHAKILHAFAGLRAVPAAEFAIEVAVQAVWASFAGPAAGFLPVGVLASKVVNVEGHVMGAIGQETFSEGSQPVPEDVYMQELDTEPTHRDYLDLAQQGAYAALSQAMGAAGEAKDTLLDGQKRQDAMQRGQKALGAAAQAADQAKDKAVVLTKGAVAAASAPGTTAKVVQTGQSSLAKGMEWGRGLLGKKKS